MQIRSSTDDVTRMMSTVCVVEGVRSENFALVSVLRGAFAPLVLLQWRKQSLGFTWNAYQALSVVSCSAQSVSCLERSCYALAPELYACARARIHLRQRSCQLSQRAGAFGHLHQNENMQETAN